MKLEILKRRAEMLASSFIIIRPHLAFRLFLHVKNLLGHKKIENTMKYTQLINFETEDKFTCKVAKTLQEATELVETGFEYVTDMNSAKLFRKRK